MGLAGEYNDLLLTEFLINELQDGTIPTIQQVSELLDALKLEYPLIGEKPLFSIKDNSVQYYGSSSASAHNDKYDRLEKDIHLLYEVMHELQTQLIKEGQRWSSFYETTRLFCDDLEDRIDTLLLMESETLGYYKYVLDDFITVDNVNLELTDAEVETGTGVVQIGHSTIQGGGASRIALSDVSSSNVGFAVVDGPGVVSLGNAPGSDVVNILNDEDKVWLALLKTTGQGSPASISVGIKLTDTEDYIEMNKLVAKMNGSTSTSAFIVTLWYSTNNVDWILVPTDAHTQSTLDSATWTFETINAKYIKFTITKNAPDDIDANGYYSWDFGFKSVKLYKAAYETRVGYTLVSTDREPDAESNVFTKAALSVCAMTHEQTNISYYLSIDQGASYHSVDPLENLSPTKPQVLDFSELQLNNNIGSSSVYDSSRDSISLDINNIAGVALETGELLLNFFIRAADVSNLIDSDIAIWRNIGVKGSTDLVRGKAKGWAYDDLTGIYSCYFSVADPDGLTIDFGQGTAQIDGVSVTGSAYVTPGSHYFETAASNWADITPLSDSIDELKTLDGLYPYNHRFLIEGYLYGSDYVDEEVYVGMNIFAELQLSYISQHGFQVDTDEEDFTVYTRGVDDDDNVLFIFKTDRSFGDYTNEGIIVTYPLMNKTFDSIMFKAVLTTTDESVSPILDSYLIKLG